MQNRFTKKSIARENGYVVDNPTVERCAKAIDKLGEIEDAEESGLLVRLPCKIGSTVWVSPNNGENFHTGKLYGMNENGSYLVFVDDKVRDFVDFPFEKKAIYDWFFKIYTREEAEQALKERDSKC